MDSEWTRQFSQNYSKKTTTEKSSQNYKILCIPRYIKKIIISSYQAQSNFKCEVFKKKLVNSPHQARAYLTQLLRWDDSNTIFEIR